MVGLMKKVVEEEERVSRTHKTVNLCICPLVLCFLGNDRMVQWHSNQYLCLHWRLWW